VRIFTLLRLLVAIVLLSGSTGGKTCSKCHQNGQHTADCSSSNESVERRRQERNR
jgi:hypothetical protein